MRKKSLPAGLKELGCALSLAKRKLTREWARWFGLLAALAFSTPPLWAQFDPQPDPPVIPAPAHWWSGDGHAQDLAGNAHGTVAGNLVFSAGRVGQAFQFDGVDDQISFGAEAGNFEAADFTVEFWMKASNAGFWAILGKRQFCNHGSFWEVRGTAFFLDQDAQGLNYAVVSPSISATDDRWHHLAYVRAGTNLYLYLDGKLVATSSSGGITVVSNAAPLVAGNNPCVGFDVTKRFTGLLDEIKIYPVAILPLQVAAAAGFGYPPTITREPEGATYNAPVAEHTFRVEAYSLEQSPYTYQWHRNGTPIQGATSSSLTIAPVNSSTAGEYTVTVQNRFGRATSLAAPVIVLSNDPLAPGPNHWWSGNGHTLDSVGNAHGTASGNLAFAAGRVGQAFAFDGVDDEISFGAEAGNFGTNDFTVEFWIQSPREEIWAVLGKREICQHGSFWEVRGSAFALDDDAQGSNYSVLGTSPLTMNDGFWHHVTYVRAGTNVWLYLDGSLASTKSTAAVAVISNTAPLVAGDNACVNFDGTKRFTGLLDEIKIYQTALIPEQVSAAAELRSTPIVLLRSGTGKLALENNPSPARFKWQIDPEPGEAFTTADIAGIELETSIDLIVWTIVPGAMGVNQGKVEIIDLSAFGKRMSFYRLVYRRP